MPIKFICNECKKDVELDQLASFQFTLTIPSYSGSKCYNQKRWKYYAEGICDSCAKKIIGDLVELELDVAKNPESLIQIIEKLLSLE